MKFIARPTTMNGTKYKIIGDAYTISGAAMINTQNNRMICITILPPPDICRFI
jgi:hypothetical protein